MESELKKLTDVDLGYPSGVNMVYPADLSGLEELTHVLKIPEQLEAFYRECGGIKLSNIWNGYSVSSPQNIVKGIASGEPTIVSGSQAGRVITFGSDGGGNLLALRNEEANEVLYLPLGIIEDGMFDGEWTPVKVLSQDFFGFLERLLADTKAFVRGDEQWEYMDKNLHSG